MTVLVVLGMGRAGCTGPSPRIPTGRYLGPTAAGRARAGAGACARVAVYNAWQASPADEAHAGQRATYWPTIRDVMGDLQRVADEEPDLRMGKSSFWIRSKARSKCTV